MRSLQKLSLIIITLGLSACAQMPPIDFTVQDVGPIENRKNAELKSLTVGYATGEQKQGDIDTGYAIPGIWKEALTDALNRSLAFKDDSKMKVNLSVRIVKFDSPSFGASMTTTTAAIYEVVDRETGNLLMTETISSEGVVPMDYSLLGATRAVESINRAARNNIAEFINRLELIDFTKPIFTEK